MTLVAGSLRRYYLRKLRNSIALDDGGDIVWRGKHNAEPGTALPASTPGYSKLIAAEYTCTEDIVGANVDELIQECGLSRREAAAVIAAYGT